MAHLEFWDWLSGKREEKRKGSIPPSQKLGDKQTWLPKYASDAEILDKYYGTFTYQDTLNAHITDDDVLDLIMDFDGGEESVE